MKNLTQDQKRRIQETMQKSDARADGWLIKIAKSKWSWAIVLGIIAAAWLLGVLL